MTTDPQDPTAACGAVLGHSYLCDLEGNHNGPHQQDNVIQWYPSQGYEYRLMGADGWDQWRHTAGPDATGVLE